MQNALLAGLAVGIVFCAVFAVRAVRLLHSAILLAATSVLLSIALYLLGGREIAVIELSVGAGLVTVLFIFALNLIAEQPQNERSLLPAPLALLLVLPTLIIIGLMVLPGLAALPLPPRVADIAALDLPAQPGFSAMVWNGRALDTLLQIALILAGVLGVLGLLATRAGALPSATTTRIDVEVSQPAQPAPGLPGPTMGDSLELEKAEEQAWMHSPRPL